MNSNRLQLGIIVDSFDLPAWLCASLEQIVRSRESEIAIVIQSAYPADSRSALARLFRVLSSLIYRLYDLLDQTCFLSESDALQGRHVASLFTGVPVLKVTPLRDGSANSLSPADTEALRARHLDVLINLSAQELSGDITSVARLGVWCYFFPGKPPGFWEVADRIPETVSFLLAAGPGTDGGSVLARTSISTYGFSAARNRNRLLWKSTSLLPRHLSQVASSPDDFSRDAIQKRDFGPGVVPARSSGALPSNLSVLRMMPRVLSRICAHLFTSLFCLDTWYLKYAFVAGASSGFGTFKRLFPPKDRFWADPHIVASGDHYYVFIEEYLYRTRKGHIAVLTVDHEGDPDQPVPILETPYHLSYPFVFEYDHKYYLIPESAAARTIDLYECSEFPHRWKHKMSLMENVLAVDTTIFHYNGVWWLFAGMAEQEAAFPEVDLFLFFADSPLTNRWTPHPLNPIATDVKNSRPAGRIFAKDGKIFRPSQDCSKFYGYGFDLNEISRLTATDYQEKRLISVRPDWDAAVLGTHTYATDGDLTCIDAFTRRPKYSMMDLMKGRK
jgi:hypothetical protein